MLATIWGEQEEGLDETLASKNRDTWNTWAARDPEGDALQEILERFRKRLKNSSRYLPNPARWCEFSLTYFARPVHFEGFRFHRGANFAGSAFKKTVSFSEAIFDEHGGSPETVRTEDALGKGASFSNATFAEDALFTKTVFNWPATFHGATFSQNAVFNEVTFKEGGVFKTTRFERGAEFENTKFGGNADFIKATFSEDTRFNNATFTGIAGFNGAEFYTHSWFSEATFNQSALFPTATFKEAARFDNATFEQNISFTRAKFDSATYFKGCRFNSHVPEFHGTELFDETVFTLPNNPEANWPPQSGEGVMPAEDQKRAYSRLRLFYAKTQQIDEEQFFHRQEMRCKRQMAIDEKKAVRWLYMLYACCADYGISIWRPLAAMGVLITLGAALFSFHTGMQGTPPAGSTFWRGMGWGLANMVPFTGFARTYFELDFYRGLPVWLKIYAGAQTLAAIPLLFLFGLGLRNTFRLR